MTAPRALTRRQREVLVLVANGNSNVQIGRWLGIHPATVARLLANAYTSLGAHDRAQAVALAMRHGDITAADIRLPTTV